MKLPPPFDNAKNVKANLDGSISLIDDQGKPLARLPLSTAFELSPKVTVTVSVSVPVTVPFTVTVRPTAQGEANEPALSL